MPQIPYGCILTARKVLKSDIWIKKPSWWLKVWEYMLLKVNHKENEQFKRGQNFFSREQIHDECKLYLDGIKAVTVDNVVRWLRSTRQITTQKTTRGIIITICNYDYYQNLSNYRNDAENDTSHEIKTRQKRDRNDTINKNDNNDKNVKNDINITSQIENLLGLFPSFIQTSIKTYWGRVANKNKSKVITEGRKLTLLNELYNSFQRCNDEKMFNYALEAAISYDAPCIGYVDKVIKNQKVKRQI